MEKNQSILHVHTMYSLYDSACSPDEMVEQARKIGCVNLTLTDHGSLLGVEPFMDAGKKYGVNTIPGIEAYLEGRAHLLIIPFDYEGFQAISHAVRDSNLHIEKVGKNVEFPIMENWVIEKHFKGNSHVFATTACIQGAISRILLRRLRTEKWNKKIEEEMDQLRPFVEQWKKNSATCKVLDEKIKKLSEEKKEYAKLSSKSKKNQLEKMKKKIPEDAEHSDYQKTKNDYELAAACYQDAAAQLDSIINELSFCKEQKKIIKKELAELRRRKEQYEKFKEKIKILPKTEDLFKEAKEKLLYLKSIFPKLFIELQNHGIEDEAYVMPVLIRIAEETQTPLIACNDAHMKDGSAESIEARRIVRFNYFETSQEISEADKTLYLKTDQELYEALIDVVDEKSAREAVANTRILEKCHVEFPQEKHYPAVNSGPSFDEILEQARKEKIRIGEWDDIYESRYHYEINIIKSMGYVDYHMVVRDFCQMGRKLGHVPKTEIANIPEDFSQLDEWLAEKNFRTGIGVGPGRGSAVGSLVCYLLGITNLDPVKYNLLFERFLNPERVTMPDIDSDIKSSLRPVIIQYLKWKYGEKAICSIVTMTTWAAKGAIQMAGRERSAQLYSLRGKKGKEKEILERKKQEYYKKTIEMSDCVPEGSKITLKELEADLKAKFGDDPERTLILEHAKLLEGKLSGTGIHAGGVVISDNSNINDYIPLAWNEKKQVWVAQCDMVRVEEKGLLKIDLLGLNTLDMISDALQMIEQYRGVIINLNDIQFEPEVFREIYAEGFTNSVFQMESPGMKSMLIDFGPTCFEDIILLVAAYRPGPMQYLPDVIQAKKSGIIKYLIPELEPILSTTYGATIYQEQVMMIFQRLAGYSLGGADLVRRAMSKKKLDKLEKEREAFLYGDMKRNITGCIANGIKEEKAIQLFDEMMDFAKYAFNKSHAAAYAKVSYITAWLKYHYPEEFLCAMLNNKDQDKFGPVIDDCRNLGIKILPPNINQSYCNFVLENGNIRYGLGGIKGVGETDQAILRRILEERKKGPYQNLHDLLTRNIFQQEDTFSIVPKKILISLAQCGALDSILENRESVVRVFSEWKNKKEETLGSLRARIEAFKFESYGKDLSYNRKKELLLLGSILSEDPLEKYLEDSQYDCIPVSSLSGTERHGSIFGFLIQTEEKISTKGNRMLLLSIQGKTGNCVAYMMDKQAKKYRLEDLENKVVKITGSITKGTIFARQIETMPPERETYALVIHNQDELRIAKEIMCGRPQGGTLKLDVLYPAKKDGKIVFRISKKCYRIGKATVIKLMDAGLTLKSEDAYHLAGK